jgi:phosphoglucosamine mutase
VHERYRTLGAMLALGDFSVAEIAALAQVGKSTVRTVLRRENDYVERVGPQHTGRRGGQPVRWRLRSGAREAIRATLLELENLGAGSWLDDPAAPESPKAAVLAAEDVLLRLAPMASDVNERAELIKLARAQVETAEGTLTPQQETVSISDHLRVVRLLLDLEEEMEQSITRPQSAGVLEQSITRPESAGVQERVWQVSHDLLLAAGRTQDMRLGDAVRRLIPDSLYATNFLISHKKPNYPESETSYPRTERDRPSGRAVLVRMRPARLFGTDGVRGIAGRDLSAPLAVDLAIAAARVLAWPDGRATRAVAVIGRDSSSSGRFLESAIIAGLTSSGVDVIRIGVAPAASVAFLTALHGAQLGVSLSASHSRAPYNGIKFFGLGGYKLQDSVEDEIERQLISAREHGSPGAAPAVFGDVIEGSAEIESYISHVLSSLPDNASKALAGLRVVVDCANGAASEIAPRLLRAAGADVTAIGVHPDGKNINIGSGSTDPGALISEVKRCKADAGIAYDGDADACIAVDHLGGVIDGDKILAALAVDLADQGKLAHRTVVMTVMANLGFRLAMENARIGVVETQVGDRYLADEIRSGDYSLGGTQSGRIIIADHATGPDGLLVSLNLLAIVARSGKTLASITDVMTWHPQVLVNVNIPEEERALVTSSSRLISAVEEAAVELGQRGRIVLRPSGTEPVVRVMVEDDDRSQAERLAHQLADTVRELV